MHEANEAQEGEVWQSQWQSQGAVQLPDLARNSPLLPLLPPSFIMEQVHSSWTDQGSAPDTTITCCVSLSISLHLSAPHLPSLLDGAVKQCM